MSNLLIGERIDDLNINGYKIIQNKDFFCFGMDAVLLSNFAKVKEGQTVLDLGTGTGIIPILLEAKTKASHLVGLEIQKDSVDMALRSVKLNGLEKKIDIIEGDIKNASKMFKLSSFDVITSNPPYMNDLHGIKNENKAKMIARHEVLCTLEDLIFNVSKILKPSGSFFMVHKPFRLAEIFNLLMKYKLEPKRMQLVHSYVDKEPSMVLIEAVRGAKSMIKIEKPLIIYKDINKYTDEIYKIYGDIM